MDAQIALFQDGTSVIPAYIKKLEVDAVTKALMGGGDGKRISIRGSVFRMMIGGKEVAVNEERAMNIVVVNAHEHISRAYYDKAYTEGENAAPVCSSEDGVYPRPDSPKLQSKTCATCPQNIKGSSLNGEGRACGFSQKLAVVLDNDLEGDVYQLNLPSQSIFGGIEDGKMPLQAYARLLASHNMSVTTVVTEARFDTKSSTPKLTFRAIRALTEAEYGIASGQGDTEDAHRAITPAPIPAASDADDDEEFETAKPVAEPAAKPAAKPAEPEATPAAAPEEKPPTKLGKKAKPVITKSAAPADTPTNAKSLLEQVEELEKWDD